MAACKHESGNMSATDLSDPDYRARVAEECRRLAQLTPDEEAMAAAVERLTATTPGWSAA
jgi:hypothetical protein